jgi:hypothetical protein
MMACSNVRSRKLSAGSERLQKIALFALFPFVLGPGSTVAQPVDPDVFTTPAFDIECTFAPLAGPELSCERFGERHLRFVLGPTGHAHIFTVSSEDGCCSTENVLEPGMTWSQGPFICRYARSGLTCEREGHGFRISKRVVVAY